MRKPNQPHLPYPEMPATAAAPKKRRRLLSAKILVPAAALVFGLVLGSAAAGSPEPAAAPAPITKTVEVPVEKIVTKTVEVNKTPEACLTALDLSETAFGYAADSISHMNDALQAAGTFDVDGINAASERMKKVNAKMEKVTGPLNAAKDSCRASK